MNSKAIMKFVRISPRKARRVADLVRGRKAGEALVELGFMPYRGAHYVSKVLRSAMANADQHEGANSEEMVISGIFVDEGPVMKRMMPRSMGRADMIRKKMSHITIHLSDTEEKQ